MKLDIFDDSENQRFIAQSEDLGAVGEVLYVHRPAYLDIYHTEVSPDCEGLGVAGAMAGGVLELVREKGLKIFPRCPYLARFLEKHPEFQDLVYT